MALPLGEPEGVGGKRAGCRRLAVIVLLAALGAIVGFYGGNLGLGLLVGAGLGAWLTAGDRVRHAGSSPAADPKITAFVDRAVLHGVIDRETSYRLLEYLRRGMTPEPGPEGAARRLADRPPAGTGRPKTTTPPAEPRTRSSPSPTAPPPRVAELAPAPPPLPRPPRRPNPLELGLRRVGRSAGAMWTALSADVAIHTVTYLGVLLLALVMFAFYGLGFYGEIISGDQWRPWRPVVAAALPALGFGVAALLRARTGIVFTANAIGFLAALSLPIALSTLFQDGAPWGPPDLDGPARWIGYAVVVIVCAAVYALAARRSTMYAYLVGPGIWTAAGALGLYLEDGIRLVGDEGVSAFSQFTSDGISWAQMAFVLAVMALTLPLTRLARGGVVASRIVRSAIVCLPVVAIFGGAFAALQGYGPGLDREAAPTVLLVATGAVAFAARGSSFAWEDARERLRRWLSRSLITTGLAVVAAGWVATRWLGVEVPWLGVGLALYAAALLLGGDRVHGGGTAIITGVRLVGAIGMGLSIIEPLACLLVWSGAGIATALADLSARWRTRWVRVYPVPATSLEGSALIAVLTGVALFGAGRLAWGDIAGWIVLAVSFALAAARWLPERGEAVRGLSGWAIPFAGSGVAVAAYQWVELEAIEGPMFGLHLLAAGAVTALAAVDRAIRLPIATAAAVPGAALALRWFDVRGSVIDASVLGIAGAALLTLALVDRARLATEAEVLGHLLVWLAPVLGSPSDAGLMIGLSAVAVTHLGIAVLVDRGVGGGSFGLGMSATASELAHAVVGVVTLPWAALLVAQEIPWFAAERPRTAIVLLAAGWSYALLTPAVRRYAGRRLLSVASQLLALAAVAVAVPSSAALLVTTWSAAVLFGWHAVRTARPASSLPAWVMAVAGSMIAAARFGVSRGDLHEPLFAAAVGLITIGGMAYRLTERVRDWALPALSLGLLGMPAALAFVIADRLHVVVFAGVAAAVYTALIWLIRTGAFAPLVAAMVSIGFADALPAGVSPFERPLMWFPLAAAILGVAALQPRREPGHWLAPVTPGLNLVWPAVLVLGGAVSLDTGELDRVLFGGAVLVALAALRWRSLLVAYAALGLVGWAGAVAGPDWLSAALTFDAVVVGIHATVRADTLARQVLAPASAALGVGAIVSLGVWHQWSLQSALIADAIVGIVTASLVVLFTLRRPAGRASLWVAPVAVVAQGALVTYAAIGWDALGDPGRYGPLAAALAVEAVLAAASALAWRRLEAAWATAALAGAAYASLGVWRAWPVGEALLATAVPALVLGVVALGIGLAPAGGRLLWEGPVHGLAQASAIAFLGIGLAEAPGVDPAVVLAGFLTFEAITIGVLATRHRLREMTWMAVALGLGGAWSAGVWVDLETWPSVAAAFATGVVAAGVASVAARAGEDTRRGLWRDATIGASQASWAAAPLLAVAVLSPETVSGLASLALGADAVFAGSLVRVLPERLRLRSVAMVLAALAALLGVGAVDPGLGRVLAILLAAVGALMLIAGSYRESGLGAWGEPVLVAGWTLAVGVPLLVLVRVDSDVILGAVLVIGGAGIVPGATVSGRWRAIYLGMAEWGLAAQFLPGQSDPNVVIVPVAVFVIVVLSIERLRARILDRPFSRDTADLVAYVELVAMVTPMVVAAWPAYERPSPGHLGLLAAEAVLLVVWALFTRVRRRLVWGVVGLVAVIVYPVARVLVSALSGGLSGGTMLAIGAVVALVLIVIGSLLERGRVRVGDVVRRLGEALEDWS